MLQDGRLRKRCFFLSRRFTAEARDEGLRHGVGALMLAQSHIWHLTAILALMAGNVSKGQGVTGAWCETRVRIGPAGTGTWRGPERWKSPSPLPLHPHRLPPPLPY